MVLPYWRYYSTHPNCSSLLHQSPLPTLDNAIDELLLEETHRGLLQTCHPNAILAAPSRPSHISSPSSAWRHSSSSSFQECRYCHEFGHKTLDFPIRPCRLCHRIGASHFPQDCIRNPEKWSKNTSSTSAPPKPGVQHSFKPPSHSTATADDVLNDSTSSALSVNDVVEIVKQIMSNSCTPSSFALSVTSDSDLNGISILKEDLYHHFKIKDLGTLSYFLGLEVSTAFDRSYLSQVKYASDLLSLAGLIDSKTASTPLEPNVRFTPLDGTPLRDPTLYRTLVGSLVYLTVTCLDIAYVVHLVSQFLSAPHTTHFAAVLDILRYIKGTLFQGLHFFFISFLS
ncbi:hypothetical protein RJ639_009527 [Escallonia herrerae]|uniref:Reverse transcriptase Ty1/copia-type domain-containing protein n=1 Tax=Escallonia herrerae TaxID=1293975 RepID=A0AA88VTP3_9ASTE|nr:hypothetical protein RJ639_009527 [Escallonia herrerae]